MNPRLLRGLTELSPRPATGWHPRFAHSLPRLASMKNLLSVTAVIELGAGSLWLMLGPSITTTAFLVGTPLEGSAALTVARVGGAGLFSLGVTCSLARGDIQSRPSWDWWRQCCYTTSLWPVSSLSPAAGMGCSAWRCGRRSCFTQSDGRLVCGMPGPSPFEGDDRQRRASQR